MTEDGLWGVKLVVLSFVLFDAEVFSEKVKTLTSWWRVFFLVDDDVVMTCLLKSMIDVVYWRARRWEEKLTLLVDY